MSDLFQGKVIGRLGIDPEVKQIGDSSAISFRMAVKNRRKDTVWVGVACWGKTADFVRQYAKKGDTVFVEGNLDIKPYTDKDGNPGTYVDISANTIVLMGSSQGSRDSQGGYREQGSRDQGSRDDWGSQQGSQSPRSSNDPIPF